MIHPDRHKTVILKTLSSSSYFSFRWEPNSLTQLCYTGLLFFVVCEVEGMEQRISIYAYQAVLLVCKSGFLVFFSHQVIKVIIEY